ncbi:hypothetical protein G6O69_10130 [Pseudenhygromyxa sp. WMMC2535]|uniref:hypothetical protein n=1 Tax=Pseudenhygromyxa sp. WMMC2535 TaxID=2712867 RepID=UPI001554B293|nr:hypothetical protein [Pseudenhygromyxa sp. WMMC2535]NVB38190.1 hypothetical protein [Pseudenhygromyxa sp. WMMC2535]
MPGDRNDILRPGELARLSALETLKGLSNPGEVKLAELVSFLESRDLWSQFSRITLGDLRDAFGKAEPEADAKADTPRKRKRRIMKEALLGPDEDEVGNVEALVLEEKKPADGGLDNDEVARMVVPFVEGNGDVTLDDIAEYTRLDRKVLRHHLGLLCKEGRLERIGVGRHAIYSAVG